jgi:hypothetical protein
MGNCCYLIDYKNENEIEFIKKKISSKKYFKKDNNDFENDEDGDLESDSESSCDSDSYYQYFFLM